MGEDRKGGGRNGEEQRKIYTLIKTIQKIIRYERNYPKLIM